MKLNQIFTLLFISLSIISCKEISEDQQELINVKLLPTFMTMSQGTDIPITATRSASETKQTIYAIQVYENDSAYYYGLFDNVSNMQIPLMTGRKYFFKITTLKTDNLSGLKQDSTTNTKGFYLPGLIKLENKFIKGNALTGIDNLKTIFPKENPQVDIFYCEYTTVLEKGTSSIDLKMLRMGFGLNLNVDGLTNGKILVELGNDTIELLPTLTSNSSIRQFNTKKHPLSSVFKNASKFCDSILIKATWIGTNGTTINMSETYVFNRNYQKTINIQLNSSGLNFDFEGWNTVTNAGLIGKWMFNGNVNDESGLNTTTNSGATMTTDRFGKANKAMYFNGSTNFIEITPNPLISSLNDFTISLWVKNEGWQGQSSDKQYIFDGHGGNKTDAGNYLREGVFVILDRYADSTALTTGILFSQYNYSDIFLKKINKASSENFYSKWHNIVYTRKGVSVKTYIDNKLYQSSIGTTKDQVLNMQHPWYIGAFCGNNPYYNVSGTPVNYMFHGSIDNLRIYNRALTDIELQSLYDEID